LAKWAICRRTVQVVSEMSSRRNDQTVGEVSIILCNCAQAHWHFMRRDGGSLLRPMSHWQFVCATLSRNLIAQQNRTCDIACLATVEQWCSSFFEPSSAVFCGTLSRENSKNAALVNFCLCDKVAVCDMHSCILQLCHSCILQLCRAIKLCDKIVRKNYRCDIGLMIFAVFNVSLSTCCYINLCVNCSIYFCNNEISPCND